MYFGLFGTILFYTIAPTCIDPRPDMQELMRISSKPLLHKMLRKMFRKMFRKLTLPAKPTSLSSIAAVYPKPGNTLLLPLTTPGDASFVMERAGNKAIIDTAARLTLKPLIPITKSGRTFIKAANPAQIYV